MNFKTATDLLGLPASELAEEFGLSTQTIRQMRLAPDSVSFRNPPDGWKKVIIRLAKVRGKELKTLVEVLERY
jgi:hypothetical protein